MCKKELQARLNLLNPDLVVGSNSDMHLIEPNEEGFADLELNLSGFCIYFKKLERNKLGYLVIQNCADHLIFEEKPDGWALHVFEMKRSVGASEWEKIKKQFSGAILNASAIAGYLEIPVNWEEVRLYSVYRNDKFNNSANPISIHSVIHTSNQDRKSTELKDEWNSSCVNLHLLNYKAFAHNKVKLDITNGKAKYKL